jgi:hypothetical protein
LAAQIGTFNFTFGANWLSIVKSLASKLGVVDQSSSFSNPQKQAPQKSFDFSSDNLLSLTSSIENSESRPGLYFSGDSYVIFVLLSSPRSSVMVKLISVNL